MINTVRFEDIEIGKDFCHEGFKYTKRSCGICDTAIRHGKVGDNRHVKAFRKSTLVEGI